MSEGRTLAQRRQCFSTPELRTDIAAVRILSALYGVVPSGRKDFETARLGVFAAPGSPLAHVQLRTPGSSETVPRSVLSPFSPNFTGEAP